MTRPNGSTWQPDLFNGRGIERRDGTDRTDELKQARQEMRDTGSSDLFDAQPTTRSYFARRLTWQSVEHTCGHFQIRLMGNYGDNITAGSPCTACAPMGRGEAPAYTTRAEANNEAYAANLLDSR